MPIGRIYTFEEKKEKWKDPSWVQNAHLKLKEAGISDALAAFEADLTDFQEQYMSPLEIRQFEANLKALGLKEVAVKAPPEAVERAKVEITRLGEEKAKPKPEPQVRPEFVRLEPRAVEKDVTKIEPMKPTQVEIDQAWDVLKTTLGREPTMADIQYIEPTLRVEEKKTKEWPQIAKATTTLRQAYGLPAGISPGEARKEIVKQAIQEKLPKGIRKPAGYETLKNQYQRELMRLAQTDLEELSEDEWTDLREKWYGKTKEEIGGIQQSLRDPTFMGQAGEFAKGFYKAHPAGVIANLLGLRPDVFQAAWDDVYTALHKEAAIAGTVTGIAWTAVMLHQMINAVRGSARIANAYERVDVGKPRPTDQALIERFEQQHIGAKRLTSLQKTQLRKQLLEGLKGGEVESLKPEAMAYKYPRFRPSTNVDVLNDWVTQNLSRIRKGLQPLPGGPKTLRDASIILRNSRISPAGTELSQIVETIDALPSIALSKRLILPANWETLSGLATRAIQIPVAITQAGPEVIVAFNSSLIQSALAGIELEQAIQTATEAVEQVQVPPVTPAVTPARPEVTPRMREDLLNDFFYLRRMPYKDVTDRIGTEGFKNMVRAGYLEREGNIVKLTPRGRQLARHAASVEAQERREPSEVEREKQRMTEEQAWFAKEIGPPAKIKPTPIVAPGVVEPVLPEEGVRPEAPPPVGLAEPTAVEEPTRPEVPIKEPWELRKDEVIARREAMELAAKEPWQMTKIEWVRSQAFGDEILKLYSRYIPKTAYQKALEKHKAIVEQALSEGKPVPPEVLAEYPDLAAKVEPTAPSRPPTAEEVPPAEEELHPEQLWERARQYPTLEEWMEPQIGDFVSFVGGPGIITGEGIIGGRTPAFKVNTAWGERIVPKTQAEVLNREGVSVGDLPAIWQEAQQAPPAVEEPTAVAEPPAEVAELWKQNLAEEMGSVPSSEMLDVAHKLAIQYPTLESWMQPHIGDFVDHPGGTGWIRSARKYKGEERYLVEDVIGEYLPLKKDVKLHARGGLDVEDLPAIWQEAQQAPLAVEEPTAVSRPPTAIAEPVTGEEIRGPFPSYKQAIRLPKEGEVAGDLYHRQAVAANHLARRQALNPQGIYDWANSHGISLFHAFPQLINNAYLTSDILTGATNSLAYFDPSIPWEEYDADALPYLEAFDRYFGTNLAKTIPQSHPPTKRIPEAPPAEAVAEPPAVSREPVAPIVEEPDIPTKIEAWAAQADKDALKTFRATVDELYDAGRSYAEAEATAYRQMTGEAEPEVVKPEQVPEVVNNLNAENRQKFEAVESEMMDAGVASEDAEALALEQVAGVKVDDPRRANRIENGFYKVPEEFERIVPKHGEVDPRNRRIARYIAEDGTRLTQFRDGDWGVSGPMLTPFQRFAEPGAYDQVMAEVERRRTRFLAIGKLKQLTEDRVVVDAEGKEYKLGMNKSRRWIKQMTGKEAWADVTAGDIEDALQYLPFISPRFKTRPFADLWYEATQMVKTGELNPDVTAFVNGKDIVVEAYDEFGQPREPTPAEVGQAVMDYLRDQSLDPYPGPPAERGLISPELLKRLEGAQLVGWEKVFVPAMKEFEKMGIPEMFFEAEKANALRFRIIEDAFKRYTPHVKDMRKETSRKEANQFRKKDMLRKTLVGQVDESQLPESYRKTAQEIRKVYDELQDEVDRVRKIEGKPSVPRMSHYDGRHIFDAETQPMLDEKYPFDDDLLFILDMEKVPPSKVRDPTALRRIGRKGGLVQDYDRIFAATVAVKARYIAFQPFLTKWRPLIEKLPSANRAFVNRWLEYHILNRPTEPMRAGKITTTQGEIGKAVQGVANLIAKFGEGGKATAARMRRDFPRWATEELSKLVYAGGMGLNIQTAMINVLQGIHNLAVNGPAGYARGSIALFDEWAWKISLDLNPTVQGRMPAEVFRTERFRMGKVFKAGMLPYRLADLKNVHCCASGALHQLIPQYPEVMGRIKIAQGAGESFYQAVYKDMKVNPGDYEEIWNRTIHRVGVAQYLYRSYSQSTIGQYPLGRILMIYKTWFQNWWTNYMPELWRMLRTGKDSMGFKVSPGERPSLLYYLAAMGLIITGATKLGINVSKMFMPWGRQPSPFWALPVNFFDAVITSIKSIWDPSQRPGPKWKNTWRSMQIFVPFWVGSRRIVQVATGVEPRWWSIFWRPKDYPPKPERIKAYERMTPQEQGNFVYDLTSKENQDLQRLIGEMKLAKKEDRDMRWTPAERRTAVKLGLKFNKYVDSLEELKQADEREAGRVLAEGDEAGARSILWAIGYRDEKLEDKLAELERRWVPQTLWKINRFIGEIVGGMGPEAEPSAIEQPVAGDGDWLYQNCTPRQLKDEGWAEEQRRKILETHGEEGIEEFDRDLVAAREMI